MDEGRASTVRAGERELWDHEFQAVPEVVLRQRVREGFAAEWERPWREGLEFYCVKYEAAGLRPDVLPAIDDVPVTTKAEWQADERANGPFGTYRAVTIGDAVRVGGSTGTTGTPSITFFGERDVESFVRGQCMQLWRAGVRPGDRFTHCWPGGFYTTNVAGGRHHLRLGTLELPMGLPTDDAVALGHLGIWRLLRPNGFQITAPQIDTYDRVGRDAGIDFGEILRDANLVMVEASLQFPAVRKPFERDRGVRVFNMSGASEIPGFINTDCRFHTGLHTPALTHLVQICDPLTGRELPPGERGHIVVTTIGLDAFVLRFNVLDIGVAHTDACRCGQSGPRYTFLGREADAARVMGHLILPIDVQLALVAVGSPEFTMQPGASDALRVLVEASPSAGPSIAAAMHVLEVPVRVDCVEPGSLPRSSFKPAAREQLNR